MLIKRMYGLRARGVRGESAGVCVGCGREACAVHDGC